MIWLTGDLHGEIDISKLSVKSFPQQKEMSREDYLIICGDFGLLWDGSATDRYWLDWLENKPWTTIWIDGNHENFDLLETFPKETWHGGMVQRIREHVLHLCRGNLFDIDGVSVFAFGGAESRDRAYRTIGKSFWPQEMPTTEEMQFGRQTLEEAGWKADIVISHSLPGRIQTRRFQEMSYPRNALTDYFDEISSCLDFRYWFSGHYHLSEIYAEQYVLLYQAIVQYQHGASQALRWHRGWERTL